MTIDPETKKYIDGMIAEQSIKVSAFLSAMCNILEQKKVITREDFDAILERSMFISSQVHAMGAPNTSNFTQIRNELERLKKDIDKEMSKREWSDLK